MNPDDLKPAWQAQESRFNPALDAGSLLREVRRHQQSFAAILLLRDLREVGTCVLMLPLWFYLGAKLALPWTWYLTVPALLWVAGFMLADRRYWRPREPGPGEPLRRVVQGSLAQVDHQIRLLRRVLWWYLLPLAVPILAFFGQVTWQSRSLGWSVGLFGLVLVAFVVIVFAGVYHLNQHAVRCDLEPRRRELAALLEGLGDEPPVPA